MAPGRPTARVAWVLAGAGVGLVAVWILGRRGQTPANDPSAALCVKAAQVFCDKLLGCGGMDRAQVPACVAHHALDCDRDVGWRIRKRILSIDPEAEQECLEGMGEARCNAVAWVLGDDEQNIFELTDRCEMDELLRPDSGLGAPCGRSSDCTSGACPFAEPGCHVCRPFQAVGEPCAAGRFECDPKVAYCDPETQRCAALRAGQAPCAQALECADGVCHGDEDGGRRCGPRQDGERCADPRDCGKASFCRAGADGGTCEPRVKNGGACVHDERSNVCLDGEASCVEGQCRVRPYRVAPGGLCRQYADCAEGLYCRWTKAIGVEGTCERRGVAGGACRPSDYGGCGLDGRCVDGTCWALGGQGDRCAAPFACKAELDCAPDLPGASFPAPAACRPRGATGEPCDSHRGCAAGYCELSGAAGVCKPLLTPGQSCAADDACATGACLRATGGGPARCAAACD